VRTEETDVFGPPQMFGRVRCTGERAVLYHLEHGNEGQVVGEKDLQDQQSDQQVVGCSGSEFRVPRGLELCTFFKCSLFWGTSSGTCASGILI
jgi:hypothetical protein